MEDQILQTRDLIELQLATFTQMMARYGLSVVYAIIVLIVGWWAAGRIANVVRRACERSDHIDNTVTGFASSITRYSVIALVIITVLQLFGFQTTSLVAVIGAASLAIGLALQGTLSNLAAGVMLLFFRPFQVGDFVELAGNTGTVKNLTMFFTELATADNVKIIIPNGDVWGSAVTNYSSHPTRRCDITVGISYDDDMDKAKKVFHAVIAEEPRILADPDPFVEITNLGDSSVDVTLRVWTSSADLWAVRWFLIKRLKEALDEAGISIPYPHMQMVGQVPSTGTQSGS
ncbi:small conductance mechanosensitive channel [Breoghania corrubedonensis]|uniref:Small-conductance mechanosensitive channel n=1 Tax=Breoghania corrubedonensis TaxID=665038 RepID=A0A2T5VEZ8_9HYPH|nr:mechanosensitive ion channel domain-containing protein [Breoghania corrubedonensis]PTW62324.1 small conductance mechanosensitive channel [Breoghania corrubedonensis]